MKKALLGGTLLLLVVLLSSLPASANEVVLTYTGNPFTINLGIPCPSTCGISLTLTLAAPLGDNLNFAFVTPLSFSINDGGFGDVINQTDDLAPSTFFEFSTNASGQIDAWAIAMSNAANSLGMFTNNAAFGVTMDETAGVSETTGGGLLSAVDNDPGTFSVQSVSATPEPASLLLLGTGLLGLGPFIRRRLLRS